MHSIKKSLLIFISLIVFNANAQITGSNDQQGQATYSSDPQQLVNKNLGDFETRSRNINTLLLAYRNIATETGKTSQIKAIENDSMQSIEDAKRQYLSNNPDAGRRILGGSYARLQQAIIGLRGGKTLINTRSADQQYEVTSTDPGHLEDRAKLIESIGALMTAYTRVAEEKGQQDQASILESNINTIRARAEKKYDTGEREAGKYLLSGAYNLVKEALSSLRHGDTLIQSLNFANDEEEYQYYLRKTHSLKSAIELLLKTNNSPSKSKLLNNLLTSAQNQLDEASALAGQNKFEAANPIMDKAFTRLQSGLMMSLSSR